MTERIMRDEEIAAALLDPSMVFACPSDVVAARGLTSTQKMEILQRWEYDVREEEVAQEENMSGNLPVTLSHVLDALNRLGAGKENEHRSPTKQGGR